MNISERWDYLKRKERRVKPNHWRGETNQARVLDAMKAKEPLCAWKVFRADGQDYLPGDPYPYDDLNPVSVARLAQHGYVRPMADVNMAKAHHEIEDFINHHQGEINALDTARLKVPQAEALVIAARAALKDAETRLSDAVAYRDRLEGELTAALAGPDVDAILAQVDAALK